MQRIYALYGDHLAKNNKFSKDEFRPKNPQKYVGSYPIIYRSSWEFTMMRLFDEHPYILAWASEFVEIPYQNPLTGKWTVYIPDFLVVYVDKNGKKHADVMEIKPAKQVGSAWDGKRKGKISKRDELSQIVNMAKWKAAMEYCARHGYGFQVASEDEIFAWQKPKKKKK
jgi:hypothetical protein